MPDIKSINPEFAVCGALTPDDMHAVATAGYRTVINNRPDNEDGPAQATSADLARAAAGHGMTYVHHPVVPNQISDADVAQFGTFIGTLPKPILAFCRSGGRAAKLYRLATGERT